MLASLALASILAATPPDVPDPSTSLRMTRLPYYGVSVTRPQQVGVFGGMLFAFPGRPLTAERHGPSGNGIVVEAEAALAGGRIAAGVFTTGGMTSAMARVVALRTWGDPWVAQTKRTYVGPEITVQFAIFRVTAGYLHGSDDDIVTAGVGVSIFR
jgi:hypothetical protein